MNSVLSACCFLLICGALYDRLVVDRIERAHPPLGVTAWEVVGGVSMTLVVLGLMTSWDVMGLAFLLFSASGIPMIAGSYLRHQELQAGR